MMNAANLLEQNGQTGAAIALLRETARWQDIAFIIILHARDMLNEGRHHLLREWIESVPPEIVHDIPWLLFFKALSMLPFTPLETLVFFEEVFDKFEKQQDGTGAMFSACGAILAIVLGYENFPPLDRWRAMLHDLAQKAGSFPDEEVGALDRCYPLRSDILQYRIFYYR